MKKINIILLLISISLFSQNKKQSFDSVDGNRSPNGFIKCATVENEELLRKNNPKRLNDQQFENWLAPLIENYKNSPTLRSETGGIITIPVVVHVIHNGDNYGSNENIRDEQVESQITVLNQDFRKISGTPGFGIGVDTQIQFALAKVDPNGNPTNGINRVNLCRADWNAGTSARTSALVDVEIKPKTIWDANQYLNMWSVNFGTLGLLGYAQFPDASGLPGLNASGGLATTDGVVSNYGTFGSRTIYPAGNYVGTQYDKGRTMTHEVGHWIGLRHLWGDGDCSVDDFCADTPNCNGQFYAGAGEPTGCAGPTQCGFIRQVENYMDYSDDNCMNIYTQNQKDRMLTVMNNSPRRVSLKSSTKDIAIPLFANDAEVIIENSCDVVDATCTSPNPTSSAKKVLLYNRGTSNLTSAVFSYNMNGGSSNNQNWTGNLAPNKYTVVTLTNTAVNGTLNISITSVNGGTDQRTSNNTASKVFGKQLGYANSTSFTFNLVGDSFGTETTWTLKNGSGTTIDSGGPYMDINSGTQILVNNRVWNLPSNGCYVLTVNDSYGDGLFDGVSQGFYTVTSGSTTVVNVPDFIVGGNLENTLVSRISSFTNNSILSTDNFSLLENINLYPNPTKDFINISIPLELGNTIEYEVYNNLGQVILTNKLNKNDFIISTSQFLNGVYFLKLNFENASKTLRFIKN
ncbi:MAG: T9SS type A sorting domain-containing protein [Flavobacterium sp.]|nr:T9SS type A sorting domain-containing protein [Flavobacterium sp.]